MSKEDKRIPPTAQELIGQINLIQKKSQTRKRSTSKADSPPPVQPDFFELDVPLLEFAFKDDIESMEAPIYSLSTRPDTKVFTWESADGRRKITISPSVDVGRATIFDKDILIYCTSQIMAAMNAGKQPSKRVRFVVSEYLRATHRGQSGDDYQRFNDAMARLRGTSITITDETDKRRRGQGFGLIDSWQVVEKLQAGRRRMVRMECTLSDWLFDAISDRKILTINPEYFDLRKPIERRLYEVARKHCGSQETWRIGLDTLRLKCGVQDQLRNFRSALRKLIAEQGIPDYGLELDDSDMVIFRAKPSALVIGETT
ncbi:hypothetical protein BUE93_22270 [Chromobacterium amazonense]|uniref:Plasmid replication initiator-like protein n=2 Tax=Chromobacterium amazonense TaxID=1382803 RepID=A0A2S9WYB0_9NEIS|nr:hypothetical protein BUE93_22270 [Chromobacterium amazonense]